MKTPKKRKRQRKTNYSTRMKLLKSGLPRVLVRRTNKYLVVQYVISNEAKDKVVLSVSSRELLKNSWPKELKGSLKSIPAAYLTGLMFGKKSKDKVKEMIIDFGFQNSKKNTIIYSALKGVIDSGISLKASKEIFPNEERLKGKHIKHDKLFETVKKSIENEK